MNHNCPIYIVSKGRADSRLTSKTLEEMGVDYRIVVEESERADYEAVIDPAKVLILDPQYQRDYDPFDDLGDTKSKGPGPARNFVWDHSVAAGHACHWVMDDNIRKFYRLNKNRKNVVLSRAIFSAMESFVNRFTNVAMSGPAYELFTPRKVKVPPFILNTRIYSCNLIRNDAPFRWRCRYNEDTDLSLRMLKAGWVTVQFNAFLQNKIGTQLMRGGNTQDFYEREGTSPKSLMLIKAHPDVTKKSWRFGRAHHHVNYLPFHGNKLRRRTDAKVSSKPDEFGMVLSWKDGHAPQPNEAAHGQG